MDANRLRTEVLHCNINGRRNRGRQTKSSDRRYKGRSEREGYGREGCSGGDWGHREVETDRIYDLIVGKPDERETRSIPRTFSDVSFCVILYFLWDYDSLLSVPFPTTKRCSVLIGSRVVSVLDSGAEGPGFKSQPRRCRVTALGKRSHPLCLCSPSSKIGSNPVNGCGGRPNCRPGGK